MDAVAPAPAWKLLRTKSGREHSRQRVQWESLSMAVCGALKSVGCAIESGLFQFFTQKSVVFLQRLGCLCEIMHGCRCCYIRFCIKTT